MNRRTYLAILISIVFAFFFTTLYFVQVITHEDAHKQIAIYNGCKEYEIHYFTNPHFLCQERSHNLTIEDKRLEFELDSINEIVGYNITSILLAIMFSGYMAAIMFIYVFVKE